MCPANNLPKTPNKFPDIMFCRLKNELEQNIRNVVHLWPEPNPHPPPPPHTIGPSPKKKIQQTGRKKSRCPICGQRQKRRAAQSKAKKAKNVWPGPRETQKKKKTDQPKPSAKPLLNDGGGRPALGAARKGKKTVKNNTKWR